MNKNKTNGHKGRVGRPTKYTPETVDKILNALAVGAPYIHACNCAGIGFDAFNDWRAKYPDFSDAIKKAEGVAVTEWLTKIEKAASDGNWQAAAWKLERRYPVDFGRREHIEAVVTHKEFEVEIGGNSADDQPTNGQAELIN